MEIINQQGNKSEDRLTKCNILRSLFHLIGCLQFSYSVYYDWTHVVIPISASHMGSGFGGKLKFLTFWDAILQSVYFTVCLINDLFGSNEKSVKNLPLIRRIRDYMYASIAFPVAMFVGVTFWALMAVDRELVLPKALDPYFPTWLNHVMHTNIMFFTLIEMMMCFRAYPKRSKGLTGLLVFMAVYLVWVHIIFSKSGVWVYPVLEVLNWWQRIIFYLVSIFLVSSLYIVGESLNKVKWGKVQKQLESGKSHRKTK